MEIQQLDELKMKTLKEVADSNLLVAQMKSELVKLEEEKGLFFTKRENEVLARIHKLLNGSRILLQETETNYTKVHEFYQVLSGFSEKLSKAHDTLGENIKDFNENSDIWQKNIDAQVEDLSSQRKALKVQQELIDKDKYFSEQGMKKLEKEARHIESKQLQIRNALEYLKNKQK